MPKEVMLRDCKWTAGPPKSPQNITNKGVWGTLWRGIENDIGAILGQHQDHQKGHKIESVKGPQSKQKPNIRDACWVFDDTKRPRQRGPKIPQKWVYRGEVSQGGVGQNAVALQLVSQLQLRVKRYSGPLSSTIAEMGHTLFWLDLLPWEWPLVLTCLCALKHATSAGTHASWPLEGSLKLFGPEMPTIRKASCPQFSTRDSGAGNGCANFMGAYFWVLSAGRPARPKNSPFGKGGGGCLGFLGRGGWKCQFFKWAWGLIRDYVWRKSLGAGLYYEVPAGQHPRDTALPEAPQGHLLLGGLLWVLPKKQPNLQRHTGNTPSHETNTYKQFARTCFLYSCGCEYRRGMYSHRHEFPQEIGKHLEHYSSKICSCIRASANTGPACIRAKSITQYFSCMYWFCHFCAGG